MSEAEEKEPSGGRATPDRPRRPPESGSATGPISFNRQEINKILEVYGRRVADRRMARLRHRPSARARGLLDLPPHLGSAALPDRQAAEARPPPGRLFAGDADRHDPEARPRPRQRAPRHRQAAAPGRRLDRSAGGGRRRLAQRALHEDAVEPAAVLVADLWSVPTSAKPAAVCRRIDAWFSTSPITAIIWRKPRSVHASMSRRRSAPPMPRPRAAGAR